MLVYKNKEYTIKIHQGKITPDVLWLFSDALEDLDYPMDEEQFVDNVDQYEHDDFDNRILFVLYHNGDPVGFFASYRNKDTAVEEHWYVYPEHRLMANIKAMVNIHKIWAKGIGCERSLIRKPNKEASWDLIQ